MGIASNATPKFAQRLARPFVRFAALEASSAFLLLAMAFIALLWANSPWAHTYEAFWHTPLKISVGEGFELGMSLGHWVNDGLMAVFFFVVGMEIKREMVTGELSTRQRAMLPVVGALGGMVVPALLYASLHQGEPTLRGWGVPMATDIAFAVAALSLMGPRVPPPLRIFLLALAIADDLGAVSVIAIFYTEEILLDELGLALAGLVLCFVLNRLGVRWFLLYVVIGLFVWYEIHNSGVHATIAGVALGLLVPTATGYADRDGLVDRGRRALERLRTLLTGPEADHGGHERHHVMRQLQAVGRRALSPLDFLVIGLERWVAFFIMPAFALANAGVRLEAGTLSDPLGFRVAFGVGLGLVIGKPLGIGLFSWIAVKTGIATLPRGVGWGALFAVGSLAGIGFTVALFVTALAFSDPGHTAASKIGILVGSALATVVGLGVLARTLPVASTGPR